MPGASRATLAPLPGEHARRSWGMGLATVHVTGSGTWTVDVRACCRGGGPPAHRRPGWRASVDGRPVGLGPWDDVMLQLTVPPGRHVVTLSYLPRAFEVGIALCAVALVVVVAGSMVALRRRRSTEKAASAGRTEGA